jgi:hypothetical protein
VRRAALVALGVVSCSRPMRGAPSEPPSNDPDGGAAAVTAPAEASPRRPSVIPPERTASLPPAGEARRTVVTRLEHDSSLRPFLTILRDHFKSPAETRYAVQHVDLAGGRTAALVTRGAELDPIVLAIDRDEIAWSKARPVGGIAPPVVHLAIAPRADGGVALFGYVASMHIVAARMWADDGNPYADIDLGSVDVCDALSAAYAPSFGWIVACASPSGTRAHRLREDGTTAWSPGGLSLGAASAVGAATILFDTPASWVLVQRVRAVGTDHLLVFRYDAAGSFLWPAPVDVGALSTAHSQQADDRVDASVVDEGVVRVEVPGGLTGKNAKAVEVDSKGSVRAVAR